MGKPAASIIISTYNSPRALNLVLRGYSCQTFRDFEIVVADDGSTAETADLVRRYRIQEGLPVRHAWQEDAGFQKCRILNKAAAAARGDYLIIVDGDCIPRADFVETHLALRQPGHYLSGAMFRLKWKVTNLATEADVVSQALFSPSWLIRHGQGFNPKQLLKLSRSTKLRHWAERLSNAHAGWNGANSSCWRDDLLRVNGFDDRLVYGGEDREFGFRLDNAGLKGLKVRYSAACVHLEHSRGYVSESGWNHNRAIIHQIMSGRVVRAAAGIDQYLGKEASFLID